MNFYEESKSRIFFFFFFGGGGGGGGGGGEGVESEGWAQVWGRSKNVKLQTSHNSCTQHIVFVTIYMSKEKDH